ncbi:MAG: DUF4160 domain-containing protein [Bacteroidales bacterium]|nr:DUF4160 domain-containing protein [Bacteroidales bacterium]
MFFSKEHEPIHVHVRGHNGDANSIGTKTDNEDNQ